MPSADLATKGFSLVMPFTSEMLPLIRGSTWYPTTAADSPGLLSIASSVRFMRCRNSLMAALVGAKMVNTASAEGASMPAALASLRNEV